MGEVVLALRLLGFAALVPALMRLPLPRLERVLEPRRRRPRRPPPALEARTAELLDAVIRRGAPLVRPGCLTRGVTLYRFLRHAGSEVELVFGVADPERLVLGHCWVAKDGLAYLEPPLAQPSYAVVYRMPSALRAPPG